MASQLFKILTILAVTTLVAGCKLVVVGVPGGDVTWSAGSCLEGNNCTILITDPNFSDSFTVTPKPGYEFVKWQKGDGNLCANLTGSCTVTMPADAGNAAAIIALFQTAYIRPVYKDVGIDTDGDGVRNELDADDDNDGVLDGDDNCPLVGPNEDGFGCIFDADGDGIGDASDPCPANPTNPCTPIPAADIVTVGANYWVQPDILVSGLSWNDIRALCPLGLSWNICSNHATLNGYDVSGWRWAGPNDIKDLFNHYLTVEEQYNGIDTSTRIKIGSEWAPAFLAQFREVGSASQFSRGVSALKADSFVIKGEIRAGNAYIIDYIDPQSQDFAEAYGISIWNVDARNVNNTVWLYRPTTP